MRIHVLHGIHTAYNDPVVKALLPYLQGDVRYPDYGFILACETKRINPAVVGTLAPYVEPDDVMVGHSNGCAIIYDLLEQGVKMAGLVLINGALRQDITLQPCVKFCHVYFNDGDNITQLARDAERLAISPVDRNWGEMGHAGYVGEDPRVTNINCGITAPDALPMVVGHSDIFTPGKIDKWGVYINQRLQESAAAFVGGA